MLAAHRRSKPKIPAPIGELPLKIPLNSLPLAKNPLPAHISNVRKLTLLIAPYKGGRKNLTPYAPSPFTARGNRTNFHHQMRQICATLGRLDDDRLQASNSMDRRWAAFVIAGAPGNGQKPICCNGSLGAGRCVFTQIYVSYSGFQWTKFAGAG